MSIEKPAREPDVIINDEDETLKIWLEEETEEYYNGDKTEINKFKLENDIAYYYCDKSNRWIRYDSTLIFHDVAKTCLDYLIDKELLT